MKPFLILQLRPETPVSDDEFEAFVKHGGLGPTEVVRLRMDQLELPAINLDDYSGVIVGGGPDDASNPMEKKSNQQRSYEPWLYRLLDEIIERDFPYFGCCYGLGALNLHQGGVVSKEKYAEPVQGIDVALTEEGKEDPLLAGLPETFRALVGHKEACQNIAPGAVLLGRGEDCPVQMVRFKQNIYAVQFHPESTPANFVLRINVYKHAGYFPPDDAERLIDEVQKEEITVPGEILRRFVERYRRG
ncbi:MAG: Glutamine amidotransferase [Parcubacteria group bacterium GW2011_GWA2_56_7]|nr:MAG: Glutamine amidotransferase [Parcubacteria group bacterium GW2011_GWA2_56_7]